MHSRRIICPTDPRRDSYTKTEDPPGEVYLLKLYVSGEKPTVSLKLAVQKLNKQCVHSLIAYEQRKALANRDF